MAKPTILVVDDDAFFRHLFTDFLAEEGLYSIEAVNCGNDALKRIRQGGVDVVLTDMVMPDICGLELLKLCRSSNNPPDVILVTGKATVDSAINALKNGARDYLIKPCNAEQLRHTVRTCLEQRRLLDENSLLRTQIRLYQRGQQLASQLEISTLFQESLNVLINEIGKVRGLAFTYNSKGTEHLSYSQNWFEKEAKDLAEALTANIGDLQTPTLLNQERLLALVDLPEDLRSIWVVPLRDKKKMRGAIALCNDLGFDLPSPLPLDNLLFLTEQISLGFQNACLYMGARELIYTDDLTGLYNYRYLHIAMEQEIRRSERYGLEFSVAFIDLDLFKNINDVHGHLVGSSVLKEVGEVLSSSVRDTDMLFRYGGDEYTILLVETDSRGAKVVAERIREKIEQHVFKSSTGVSCHLTATVGHATYPIHATSKKDLIDLADKAMYQGKIERNTTCSATDIRQR